MRRTAHQILVNNLFRLMEARQIENANQLAKLCKMNQKTLNNLLSTDRGITPNLGTIQRLADALRVPPWALLVPDLPVREININGFPDTASAAGLYLMASFDTFDETAQREVLGYTAYVLDREGDVEHRDKIREISATKYLLAPPKRENSDG